MYVGSDLATEETLGDLVQKELRKGSGGREVHVKGDRRAAYGAVRRAMELINAVGVPQVHLGSEEYKEGK
jgi:biopolymer transport protein ExbD